MLPDLIEAPPTLKVGFEFSLPHDLFTTLSLVVKSAWRDGFSEWVYESAAALGPGGRAETGTLTPFLAEVVRGPRALLAEIRASHPLWNDLDAFLAYLRSQPPTVYETLAYGFIEELHRRVPEERRHASASLRDLLAAYVTTERETRGVVFDFDIDLALAMIEQPAQLGQHLPTWIGRFGQQHYLPNLEAAEATLRSALAYHQRQRYPGPIATVFAAVTGRALPQATQATLEAATSVVFVPSLHIGPYFYAYMTGPYAYVSFNARTAGAGSGGLRAIPDVVQLFPPLKALADESRLHILAQLQRSEHTQESLSAALGISQSMASRHLGLLERVGLVQARREAGVKYYSVQRTAGRDLVSALESFLA